MSLVLLPPIGLDAGCWSWLDLPAGAAARHEFPGLGRRPRAPTPTTLAALADDVAASYPGPLDVAGVSLGGMVALELALRHPGRVRSLLVACAGAAADPEVAAQRAAATEAGGIEAVLEPTLERWFTAALLAARREHPAVAYVRATLRRLEPASLADAWRAIAAHDVRGRLAEIRAPVTCVAATADVAIPVDVVEELAAGLPRSRLARIDGPHMIQLERPAETSSALREHLRWVEEG